MLAMKAISSCEFQGKLYGNLEELRRTAAFVRATGISI